MYKLCFQKWVFAGILFFLFSFTSLTQAQTGTINGILKDSISNEPIVGAIVACIENPAIGAQTDYEGYFEIGNVKPGVYNFVISYIGYKSRTLSNVEVKAGDTLAFNDVFIAQDNMVAVIEIVAQAETNTETAVVQEVRAQEQVVSGISAEQITKSQDRDAAQVVSRVSGVTVIDNSFVLVRGLNRRYNGIMLNGVMAPSSEIDSRAFALDLIPSSMLDRMLVFKSGSDELPGDMTGSLIKLYTRNSVSENFNNLTFSLSYRPNTTFASHTSQSVGGTEFLGFSNNRAFPSSFPANLNASSIIFDPVAQENAAKQLTNDWNLHSTTALPDMRIGFNTGHFFHVNKIRVSNITSLSYSNTSQYYSATRSRNLYVTPDNYNSLFDYKDEVLQKNARLGIIFNWAAVLNERNKIEFRNMFNQNGLSQTVLRTGLNKKAGSSPQSWAEVDDRALYYQERGIYSGQLGGTHSLTNNKTSLDWTTGYSYIFRNEPDYRRAGYQRNYTTNDPFIVVVPSQATDNDAARFESKLREKTIALTGNLEHQLMGQKDSINSMGLKLRAGFYAERRSRTFESRWMSYIRGNSTNFDYSIMNQPLETIFSDENINQSTGFILNEGTDGTNKYTASNTLFAGYGGGTLSLSDKVTFNGGIRVEHNIQILDSKNQSQKNVNVNNPITNILPSLSVNYNFTERMQVRAAFATTINRPEFRELAPFGFYDFENSWKIVGNPDLKNAVVQNFDVRWEYYPSDGEAITLGAFYKDITNPIEFYIQPIGGQDQNFEYRNAPKATCYGLELEIRKSLSFIAPAAILKPFSVVLNASLIKSQVDLQSNVGGQSSTRPLQGQSPYVINAALYYENKEKKMQANLIYNVFGNRIFGVGDASFATIYEMNRNTIDFTFTKGITDKLEIKAGAQNILNAAFKYTEDANRDFKITGIDNNISTYRRGAYFTLGASLRF